VPSDRILRLWLLLSKGLRDESIRATNRRRHTPLWALKLRLNRLKRWLNLIEDVGEKCNALCLNRLRNGIAVAFRVRIARLAHLPTPPVQIVALQTNPVSRLLLSCTLVSGIDNWRILNDSTAKWSNLSLLRKGFIIRPIHDARSHRVHRDVADPASGTQSMARWCEEGIGWSRRTQWHLDRVVERGVRLEGGSLGKRRTGL